MILQVSRYATPAPTIAPGINGVGEMKTTTYGVWLIFGLSVVCLGTSARELVPKEPKAGIRVRILNPATIPANTLRRAEQMAAAVLDNAGISVTWVECPCAPDLGPNEFWLHMLRNRPPGIHGDATGFAVLMPEGNGATSYAGVVWPAVEEVADSLESAVSDVLGATVAHEIGHILLGSKAHTRSGIMRSRFERAEMRLAASGELRFGPAQAQRMRANVEAREF
jgi:hypothetical protein